MDLKITQRRKNPALRREELVFETESKTTPKRKDIREKIVTLIGAKPELVIVDKIAGKFGTTINTGNAFVYENEKELQKTELQHVTDKSAGIKREKKAKRAKKKVPAEKK